MPGKDEYYNRSKQQGYRSRASYKLKQLDEEADLFERRDTVVDLGAVLRGLATGTRRGSRGKAGTVVGVNL